MSQLLMFFDDLTFSNCIRYAVVLLIRYITGAGMISLRYSFLSSVSLVSREIRPNEFVLIIKKQILSFKKYAFIILNAFTGFVVTKSKKQQKISRKHLFYD